MAFLTALAVRWLAGENPFNRRMPTLINTAHPGLCRVLRRSPDWAQVSCKLYGDNKARSVRSIAACARRQKASWAIGAGYGGHFRALQGFRYYGSPA